MNRKTSWLFLLGTLTAVAPAFAALSTRDLVGQWNGLIQFGKIKFKLNLNIAAENDGKKVKVSLDIPEQGAKDLPIPSLLFNDPDIRIEIDQIGTAFNGKLSEDRHSIAGQFEEGPGGRPIPVTFKKNTEPAKAGPVKLYAFSAGEPLDFRGYWKAGIESQPGVVQSVGLRLGRLPDGSYDAQMDSFHQGAYDIPATSVTLTNGGIKLNWQLFNLTFEAKLEAGGQQLKGEWKQGSKPVSAAFERLQKPATVLPADLSFLADAGSPQDIRGSWKGTLDVGGTKLRLVFKVGKSPDGTYAGTLASLDQGGRELLVNGIGYTNPVVRIDCKLIRGTFTGNLNKAGSEIEGSWEQMGNPLPLKLERVPESKPEPKP